MAILTTKATSVRAVSKDSATDTAPVNGRAASYETAPQNDEAQTSVPTTLAGGDSTRAGAWRQAMKSAVRSPAELCRRLDLPAQLTDPAACVDFPLFVPLEYLDRIRPRDPRDPLLLQVLPVAEERRSPSGFSVDPVADAAATLQPGLLQKYRGRALIVTTGACAVHCRYCFRRHFPYNEVARSPRDWQASLSAIAADESIEEVILSGGDPLTLSDEWLGELARQIAAISHVRRLRVHSRLPVMIPQRVDASLLEWFTGSRLTPLMVVHVNHAQEINAAVAASFARLIDAGAAVLNQAVLLRGVNDTAAAQIDLCKRLVDLRVMPYYLHQLDRVTGAAHFETPIEKGRQIIDRLRAELPGYAVPRYVQEIPGAAHKVELA